MLDDVLPNTVVNTPTTLIINGIAAELNGVIARNDADATLMKFELSEQANKIISELVSGRKTA
jgi:hypothetical protein